MQAIVFDLGITKKDVVEKPINKDFVMVSPLKVLLSGIENAIFSGILWVEPNKILGSSGIVKIRDIGLEVDKGLENRDAVVLPYSKKYGGIGTEVDGIMAEKPVLPYDSIVILPEDYELKYILYGYASIALQLRKVIKGLNLLILGGGLTSYISALAAVGYANKTYIYNDEGYKLRLYGVEEVKNSDNIKFDAVFITTMRSWARIIIQNLAREGDLLILPRFLNSWPALIPSRLNVKFIEPSKFDGVFEFIDEQISEKIFKELVAESDTLEASLPTPKPGVILDAKKIFT